MRCLKVCRSANTKEQVVIDHERNLIGVLERTRKCNLKLNKQKLKLRMTKVRYMVHLLPMVYA